MRRENILCMDEFPEALEDITSAIACHEWKLNAQLILMPTIDQIIWGYISTVQ